VFFSLKVLWCQRLTHTKQTQTQHKQYKQLSQFNWTYTKQNNIQTTQQPSTKLYNKWT